MPALAPGPVSRSPLGSLPELRRHRLAFLVKLVQRHGPIVRFRLGPLICHLLTEPAHLEHVLKGQHRRYSKKTRGFSKLTPLLGQGLLISEGDFWLRQRRIAQPAFHRERIAGMAAAMAEESEALATRWAAQRGQRVAVLDDLMALTLRIAGRTMFGADLGSEAAEVGEALGVALHWANDQMTRALPIPPALPTRSSRQFVKARATLDRVVEGVIAQRRRDGGDRGDLLSMFMATRDEETGESMNDRQLRDEVMTLLMAGHETTANGLAWAFALLSQHPDIARRLRDEIRTALGERRPTLGEVMALPLLDRVVDEVLRLYPPAWSIGRRAEQEDELGGFHIPKHSLVIPNVYLAHRNPSYWPNPEGFDPDRFLEGESEKRPRFAYLPFGGGPRQCIGNSFALLEMKLALAIVLQRLELALPPGARPEPEPGITLRPLGGLTMQVV